MKRENSFKTYTESSQNAQNGNKTAMSKLDSLRNEMKQALLKKQSKVIEMPQTASLLKYNTSPQLGLYQVEKSRKTSDQSVKVMSKIDSIRSKIVGFNTRYMSPFHIQLETVYVDHTATNRAYNDVEHMVAYAKKFAANPHTQFSQFGKFSTGMMHYAQESMLNSFSASKSQFVALPTGSGSTGAIEKAMKIIKFQENMSKKPPVYITPYEHHSNILPWVQFYDEINQLAHDKEGTLNMGEIQRELLQHQSHNIIVSASAASNVTSMLTDVEALNTVIKNVRKKKNVIFALDCAAYCCHHELNFKILDQLDFAYLSPHKNLGGSQTCGILIARKSIISSAKPTFPGGGTVSFVKGYTKEDVMYDMDIFNRQIAGTPPFFGFYRAALCFELAKNHIGYDFIHQRQKKNTKLFMKLINQANERFKQNNMNHRIVVYGTQDLQKRANVVTFNLISKGALVQHSYASLIFTDVFGIQLRSGCFCAGPYGMTLLDLDKETAETIQQEVSVGILKGKPGYLRLDLTFYLEPFEIQYIAKAIIGLAQFSTNMQLVYTICNDGEIKRHKLFEESSCPKYSLNFGSELKQIMLMDREIDEKRLQQREKTIAYQLQRGLRIIQKPVKFLRQHQKK